MIPASSSELAQRWQQEAQPFLLVDAAMLKSLPADGRLVLGSAQGLTLISKLPEAGLAPLTSVAQ